jgi:hypothetical protein
MGTNVRVKRTLASLSVHFFGSRATMLLGASSTLVILSGLHHLVCAAAPNPAPQEMFCDTAVNSPCNDKGFNAQTCPYGYAIGGLHDSNHWMMCRRVYFQNPNSPYPNRYRNYETHTSYSWPGHDNTSVHTCEDKEYAVGWDGNSNMLICEKNAAILSGGTTLDTNSQQHWANDPANSTFHVCNGAKSWSTMFGIYASDNLFVCQGIKPW